MRRGARVAESGGLENRCTLTGTVGSNPTLSARENRQGDKGTRRGGDNEDLLPFSLSPCPPRLITERSPNWYGTALEARRAERPVRVRVPLSPLLRSQISNLRFESQAPDSVQSRTCESLQDRKVATVALFGCAAESPEPVPFSESVSRCSAPVQYRARKQAVACRTACFQRRYSTARVSKRSLVELLV